MEKIVVYVPYTPNDTIKKEKAAQVIWICYSNSDCIKLHVSCDADELERNALQEADEGRLNY